MSTTHRIPAGIYSARGIAGSEQYGTTSNGNDQIVVDLTLLADADGREVGEQVSVFLVFSDKAAPFSIERLRALGWTGTDLSQLDGIDRQEVQVQVKYEEYRGEQKMKVEILTGGGRVALKNQLDASGKKAFAAKFADLAKATAGPATAKASGSGPMF